MANKLGILSITWQNIKRTLNIARSKENLIGSDQHGNKYYERPANEEKGVKLMRRVEPLPMDEKDREKFGSLVDEFSVPEVPTEWMAWLQKKRDGPPSTGEIKHNEIYSLQTARRGDDIDQKELDNKPYDYVKPTAPASAKKAFPTYGEEYEKVPGADEDKVK